MRVYLLLFLLVVVFSELDTKNLDADETNLLSNLQHLLDQFKSDQEAVKTELNKDIVEVENDINEVGNEEPVDVETMAIDPSLMPETRSRDKTIDFVLFCFVVGVSSLVYLVWKIFIKDAGNKYHDSKDFELEGFLTQKYYQTENSEFAG